MHAILCSLRDNGKQFLPSLFVMTLTIVTQNGGCCRAGFSGQPSLVLTAVRWCHTDTRPTPSRAAPLAGPTMRNHSLLHTLLAIGSALMHSEPDLSTVTVHPAAALRPLCWRRRRPRPNPHTASLIKLLASNAHRSLFHPFLLYPNARRTPTPVYHSRNFAREAHTAMRALAIPSSLSTAAAAAQSPRAALCRAAPPLPRPATAGLRRLERRQPQIATAAVQQTTSPAAAQEQGEQALLQGVTDGTELAGATLALAYDAQRDGWSADAFHSKVDGRGPALVVALTGERGVSSFQRQERLGGLGALNAACSCAGVPRWWAVAAL